MARRKRRKKNSVIKSLNQVSEKVNNKSGVSVAMIITILCAGLMISFIWHKIRVNHLIEEIEELKKQELLLIEENEKSRATVLNLMNDSRIIGIAENKLHMIFPQYEVVKEPENSIKHKRVLASIFTEDQELVPKEKNDFSARNIEFAH